MKIVMTQSLFQKIRRHKIVLFVIIIVLFILLVILGYTMDPDETWKPAGGERTTASE
jgi:hypothetical protein